MKSTSQQATPDIESAHIETTPRGDVQSARSRESIRLFESNTLEKLSHVHPIVPLFVWSPLVIFLLYLTVQSHQINTGTMIAIAFAGVFSWSFTEYFLHRFIFHFKARSAVTKNLVFTFHGVHHATPQDKTRLVMPPTGALLFIGMFWLLFGAILPDAWVKPFFAFFIVGYLIYDYIHYAIHHFPMKNPVAKYLKTYHMQHHFKTPRQHYGVSSPFWDYIFRTH